MTSFLSREMGFTHAHLLRLLPRVLEGQSFQTDDLCISVRDGARCLTIRLDPESERHIGLLRLPVTGVNFEFQGFSQEEITEFIKRFDCHYQCGGG